MAGYSLLEGTFSDTDVGTPWRWSTASLTWPAGASAGVIAFAVRTGSAVPGNTASLFSGGWTTMTTELYQAVGTVSAMYVCRLTGTPTNGVMTIQMPSSLTYLARTWAVGYYTSAVAADPIGLVSVGGGTATSGTATLAGTPLSDSLIQSWFNVNFDTSLAADAGWTEETEPNATTPVINSALVTAATVDQTYGTSWTTSGGYGWGIWEVLNQAAAGLGPVIPLAEGRWRRTLLAR